MIGVSRILVPLVILVQAVAGIVALGFILRMYLRRHSRAYLFVVVGISTILGRAIIGASAWLGYTPHPVAAAGEDVLDVLMVLAFAAAIVTMRSTEARVRDVTHSP